MRFIEFGTFTRRVYEHMDDDEYRALQNALQENPHVGVVVPGTGGVRKLRWAGSGRGKRGGLRIYIYGKGEQEDLSPGQKRALRKLFAQKG
jgi:hypothetical protein